MGEGVENLLVQRESNNTVLAGRGVELVGSVSGSNNNIRIGDSAQSSLINISVNGDNNVIEIESTHRIKNLHIRIGNNVKANGCRLKIGKGFWSETNLQFLLYNHGNILEIGDECMFSNSIIIRLGDRPHLLFDSETGEYLDKTDGVFIGDHVWIGERVYITKNVTIPSECIVGVNSVVTRRFEETNCAIAGNPAKVVRQNVQWIRNSTDEHLHDGSKYAESYRRYEDEYE